MREGGRVRERESRDNTMLHISSKNILAQMGIFSIPIHMLCIIIMLIIVHSPTV